MKSLIRTIVAAYLLICCAATARAQEVLQVATKKIERTVSSPAIRTLYISAEKADIELTTWDKEDIHIILELSARHPDKATAASELSKVQYIAERNGKDYFLRNYILLKSGETKPVSNLKARYVVHLPASCAIDLKNSFGSITLKGPTNNIQMKADFCTTNLLDLKGKGQVKTSFGELKSTDLDGIFTFTSDHTRLVLNQLSGAITLRAEYGSVEIYPSAGLASLGIHSKKTEVTVLTKNWQIFDYNIYGAYANVKLPNGFKWKKNTADFKEAFFDRKQLATVDINAEFGQVTIR